MYFSVVVKLHKGFEITGNPLMLLWTKDTILILFHGCTNQESFYWGKWSNSWVTDTKQGRASLKACSQKCHQDKKAICKWHYRRKGEQQTNECSFISGQNWVRVSENDVTGASNSLAEARATRYSLIHGPGSIPVRGWNLSVLLKASVKYNPDGKST